MTHFTNKFTIDYSSVEALHHSKEGLRPEQIVYCFSQNRGGGLKDTYFHHLFYQSHYEDKDLKLTAEILVELLETLSPTQVRYLCETYGGDINPIKDTKEEAPINHAPYRIPLNDLRYHTDLVHSGILAPFLCGIINENLLLKVIVDKFMETEEGETVFRILLADLKKDSDSFFNNSERTMRWRLNGDQFENNYGFFGMNLLRAYDVPFVASQWLDDTDIMINLALDKARSILRPGAAAPIANGGSNLKVAQAPQPL